MPTTRYLSSDTPTWRDIAGYATLIERNLNGEDKWLKNAG